MGNGQSNIRQYQKLYHVMPSLDRSGWDTPATSWFDKSSKPFASDKDRDQFIYATISVLSQNGNLPLDQHDFRLLYTRRENDRVVARIVAEREGVIKAQVEPHEDGKDQAEAFKALRRHVEMALDRLLKEVPGASGLPASGSPLAIAGPSSRSPGPASPTRRAVVPVEVQGPSRKNVPSDAPPAYGNAVKEWQSIDDSKK